jgi:hypothetical protein
VDRGEEKTHRGVVSCQWAVASGSRLVAENATLVQHAAVSYASCENQNNFASAVQESGEVGSYYPRGVLRFFDISVDGYQLLARLARSDELCRV